MSSPDGTRLLDSDLFALATGEEFKVAVALWCKAWGQVPAGSLPNDDRAVSYRTERAMGEQGQGGIRILRLRATLGRRSIGRTKHFADIRAGRWTRPVRLGVRAVGWPESEVQALLAATLTGQSDEDLCRLVDCLHAARAAVSLETPDRALGMKQLHAGRDRYWAARRAQQTCPAPSPVASIRSARRSSRSAD